MKRGMQILRFYLVGQTSLWTLTFASSIKANNSILTKDFAATKLYNGFLVHQHSKYDIIIIFPLIIVKLNDDQTVTILNHL